MSQGQQENVHDATGQGGVDEIPEFVGSDVVDRNTRVISQNLVEILTDQDAPQWDSGTVILPDGYQFQLWSAINREPVNGENESLADFTARQLAARTDRIILLANRAQRTLNAQRDYPPQAPPPRPPLPRQSPSNSVIDAERLEKQVLLKRLATRVAEDTTDPLDKPMIEYIDRVEAEAARAAFQKVLNGTTGLDFLDDDEREVMLRWKSKSELQTQKWAEEASRQLSMYANIFASERPHPADTPRVTPIRVTCPKFTPASDPIGSLETWLAGVQNFHSLQRITDLEDKKKVLFSSIDINAQYRLGSRLLPNSTVTSCAFRDHRSFIPRDYSRQHTERWPSPGWAMRRPALTRSWRRRSRR